MFIEAKYLDAKIQDFIERKSAKFSELSQPAKKCHKPFEVFGTSIQK